MHKAGYAEIDMAAWPRARHYALYADAPYPYVSFTTELDVTALLENCRRRGRNFFSAFLYSVMVGNSVKSDILPVLAIGGHAVHVPFHDTWIHEQAEPPAGQAGFHGVESIRDVPGLPLLRDGELRPPG